MDDQHGLPETGPDLLSPPHVVPALIELFAGDRQQAIVQQEAMFAHLVSCQYCRIAVMVLLGVAQEVDRRNQEPEEDAHALLMHFADMDRKIGLREAQRYERLAVYAEMIVEKSRDEAAALFPELAAHLGTCSDCRLMVEETVSFLTSEEKLT